jgi:hypothetical protein
VISGDTVSILGASYLAGSEKARRELGWTTRSPEEGFRETLQAIAQQTPPVPLLAAPPTRRQIAALSLAAGLAGLLFWLRRFRPRK